jgi:hypothetical protein
MKALAVFFKEKKLSWCIKLNNVHFYLHNLYDLK